MFLRAGATPLQVTSNLGTTEVCGLSSGRFFLPRVPSVAPGAAAAAIGAATSLVDRAVGEMLLFVFECDVLVERSGVSVVTLEDSTVLILMGSGDYGMRLVATTTRWKQPPPRTSG